MNVLERNKLISLNDIITGKLSVLSDVIELTFLIRYEYLALSLT